MKGIMGNGCCGILRSSSTSGSNSTSRPAKTSGGQDCHYTAMNKDEEGARVSAESDKTVKFGPMVLKDAPHRIALLIAPFVDDGFFGMQNVLAKGGWQSAVASSEEEAEERFAKLWPHLIIIDARKAASSSSSSSSSNKQQKSFNAEHVIRKLRSFTEDDGTLIFVIVEKISPDDKIQKELLDAGASKLLKCCPKSLGDELHWIERVVLPIQLRLRSCAALFSALEHVDNAVEITSSERIVQFVNSKFEQLTGCHKDEVLGTFSSDLRRKSLPKEGGGGSARTATAPISPQVDASKLNSASSSSPPTSARSLGDDEHSGPEDPAWKCINVPGPSSQHCSQLVHVKPASLGYDGGKNGFYHRPPSLRFTHPSVDTPVSEIIGLLKDVQKRCEHDEEIQRPIQQAVTILNSTELYSPALRFKQEDKVASDLFGGLVLNGPVSNLPRGGRKTSLSEAMRADINKLNNQRTGSGLLRCMSPDVRAVLQLEETWQFDIFELERLTFRRPLVHLGMKILQRWRVREFLQCTESCLRSWLDTIEAHYHPSNPYHNSTHAADVLQATAYYLGKENVGNMLEHSDAVAALLASIIHDVDHPGKGSAFLINTKHPLALLYNDVSVLESHHAALGFQLSLTDHRINIFARLSRQDYTSLRKSIVDMVLATDMNKHFEHLAKFQQTILTPENTSPEADRVDPRRTLCRLLIKCADVSNPTRPWVQCKDWAYRIVEEYFAQTAEERAKGLPLTMEVFDRDACNVPRTQTGFIDMFIREMFQSFSKFGNMPELLEHIEDNYKHWKEEAEIWPKQRATEFENIQRYMKQQDALRHIAFMSGGGRVSVDSTAAGATFLMQDPNAMLDPSHNTAATAATTLVTTAEAEGSDDDETGS